MCVFNTLFSCFNLLQISNNSSELSCANRYPLKMSYASSRTPLRFTSKKASILLSAESVSIITFNCDCSKFLRKYSASAILFPWHPIFPCIYHIGHNNHFRLFLSFQIQESFLNQKNDYIDF